MYIRPATLAFIAHMGISHKTHEDHLREKINRPIPKSIYPPESVLSMLDCYYLQYVKEDQSPGDDGCYMDRDITVETNTTENGLIQQTYTIDHQDRGDAEKFSIVLKGRSPEDHSIFWQYSENPDIVGQKKEFVPCKIKSSTGEFTDFKCRPLQQCSMDFFYISDKDIGEHGLFAGVTTLRNEYMNTLTFIFKTNKLE